VTGGYGQKAEIKHPRYGYQYKRKGGEGRPKKKKKVEREGKGTLGPGRLAGSWVRGLVSGKQPRTNAVALSYKGGRNLGRGQGKRQRRRRPSKKTRWSANVGGTRLWEGGEINGGRK